MVLKAAGVDPWEEHPDGTWGPTTKTNSDVTFDSLMDKINKINPPQSQSGSRGLLGGTPE